MRALLLKLTAAAAVATSSCWVCGSANATLLSVLYDFCNFRSCSDGSHPSGGLIKDKKGNFYGITAQGGPRGVGTLFELSANGQETVLHAFVGSDGSGPVGGLIRDKTGNLFGTTASGGAFSSGTAFEFASNGIFTTLYSFCTQASCTDGSDPQAGLIFDPSGNLYGTTKTGGTNTNGTPGGTVFKIGANGGTETVLYNFCSLASCADGQFPLSKLIMDSQGNLYGTTVSGGANNQGTIFVVPASGGSETVLYSFCAQTGCTDGAGPYGSLIMDKSGNLYGTTEFGGGNSCGGNGCGVLFEIPAGGTYTVLHSFIGSDGQMPESLFLKKGNMFGQTQGGGFYTQGTIFKFASGNLTTLYNFDGTDGQAPLGGLISDKKGNLYGMTNAGGNNNDGTIFVLKP